MDQGGGRRQPPRALFCPCSYEDDFIRDTAQRINFIAYLADRDFEAARFMQELIEAALARARDQPRGA